MMPKFCVSFWSENYQFKVIYSVQEQVCPAMKQLSPIFKGSDLIVVISFLYHWKICITRVLMVSMSLLASLASLASHQIRPIKAKPRKNLRTFIFNLSLHLLAFFFEKDHLLNGESKLIFWNQRRHKIENIFCLKVFRQTMFSKKSSPAPKQSFRKTGRQPFCPEDNFPSDGRSIVVEPSPLGGRTYRCRMMLWIV